MIENVFGIMAVKWRILLRPIEAEPETTVRIVLAICALHNYVIDEAADQGPALADTGLGNDDNGRWRQQAPPMMPLPARRNGNRPTQAAINMRQMLVDFFNGQGAVEWQNDYA